MCLFTNGLVLASWKIIENAEEKNSNPFDFSIDILKVDLFQFFSVCFKIIIFIAFFQNNAPAPICKLSSGWFLKKGQKAQKTVEPVYSSTDFFIKSITLVQLQHLNFII